MKTVEEEFLLKKIEHYEEQELANLEADLNHLAKRSQQHKELFESIYFLVQDGYKYRELQKGNNC